MRQIKFRGQDLDGKMRYGNFVAIMPMSSFPAIVDEGGYQHEVKPDTVAQLVYVDDDDQEYYEGDTMTKDGRKWRVELRMYWTEV